MIVIVKLGGAAITNKKGVCELANEIELNKIMDQIQQAYQHIQQAGHQMILVHGAGSFGHPQATQYQLKTGWSSLSLKGMSHIRQCLQLLNHHIIARLEARNVPVMAIAPIDVIVTRDCEKTPSEAFLGMVERVQKYLDLGFIPVLHGDAVLDSTRGCTILSGDVIMYQLTKLMKNVVRCVFITDVQGIYQHDPKTSIEKNELIRHVIAEQEDDTFQEKNELMVADVTGGMRGKISWAKKMVLIQKEQPNRSIEAVICKYDTSESTQMISFCEIDISSDMTLFTAK